MIWKINPKTSQKGQIMLLSAMLLGSSALVFTSIAGYLMIQRLRTSANAVDSTKAIFAADAGIECELYKANLADLNNPRSINCAKLSFQDDKTQIYTEIIKDNAGSPQFIKSIGTYLKSKRAFLVGFAGVAYRVP
ncbi:MAG: hypothetical protein QMD86_02905 [Patescibacteria group bacterium]|nr:hypothetical protein [Patescibacteria group bacterium]